MNYKLALEEWTEQLPDKRKVSYRYLERPEALYGAIQVQSEKGPFVLKLSIENKTESRQLTQVLSQLAFFRAIAETKTIPQGSSESLDLIHL